jgi:surfactin family lipopeptide synthetase A
VLQGCEGVQQSVVLWRQQGEGEGRLVAYVVGEAGAEAVTSRQVRGYVQERLPEYLQPSQVVVLEALPRLPNSKVDRRSLAGAERQQEGLDEEERIAPRTPLEELLAAIWCELLGCSQVGIYDDFFELGGHSLLATRLLFRIQTALQVELPVQMLFDYSTIAELAVIIEQKQTLLINQTGNEELAEMLTALEELSDEEIRTILTAEM